MVFVACYWHWDSSGSGQEDCFSAHELGLPNCCVSSFQAVGCWVVEVHLRKVQETWSAAPVAGSVTSTSDRGCRESESHDRQPGMPIVVRVNRGERTSLGVEGLLELDHDWVWDGASRAGPKDKYEAQHPVEIGLDECRVPKSIFSSHRACNRRTDVLPSHRRIRAKVLLVVQQ